MLPINENYESRLSLSHPGVRDLTGILNEIDSDTLLLVPTQVRRRGTGKFVIFRARNKINWNYSKKHWY